MPKIPVTIGDMKFEAKGDALLFFRYMLNQYAPGDRVSPVDEHFLR